MEVKQKVEDYTKAMMKAANLDRNQGTTLVYYCIMTWYDGFDTIPIINLNGESGTGKSSGIMRQMIPWCNDAKMFSVEGNTETTVRDKLANINTVFVDEADHTKDTEAVERWYKKRTEIANMEEQYRKQYANSKGANVSYWEKFNHFGFTILHTQEPLITGQMSRRCLTMTVYKNNDRQYKVTNGLDTEPLKELAQEVNWDIEVPVNTAWDVWKPFYCIGKHVGDEEYCKWIEQQIEKKLEEDNLTTVKGIVFSEIAELCGTQNKIAVTEIKNKLRARGYNYHERQIASYARGMGFDLTYPHNKCHIQATARRTQGV